MFWSVIVEVRPHLQACNVFLVKKTLPDVQKAVKIKIISESIVISWSCEDDTVPFKYLKLDLPGCKIMPKSLSALVAKKNSISFRLLTEPNSNLVGSFASEVLKYKQHISPKSVIPQITVNKTFHFSCKCCENILSKDIMFERVLPLPSASWEAGDWFCHRHSNSSQSEEVGVHKLKDSDCLYGTCFVFVPISTLITVVANASVVRCKRCLSWLGTSHGDRAKLWNCCVNYGNTNQVTSALDDFVFIVKNAIHESIGMLCRLIIETSASEKEKHYLLLWAMDKDLELLVGFDLKSQKGPDVKLENTCLLKSKQTIKLLYLFQEHGTQLVTSWQQDINVQTIDVAKQVFSTGLQHLMKVTQLISSPNQMANNFYVSYLGTGIH